MHEGNPAQFPPSQKSAAAESSAQRMLRLVRRRMKITLVLIICDEFYHFVSLCLCFSFHERPLAASGAKEDSVDDAKKKKKKDEQTD